MKDPLECAECDREVLAADVVWFRPFANATREPRPGGPLNLSGEVGTSDNGGLPFHRGCLERRLGERLDTTSP